jgi:hypothetical protein
MSKSPEVKTCQVQFFSIVCISFYSFPGRASGVGTNPGLTQPRHSVEVTRKILLLLRYQLVYKKVTVVSKGDKITTYCASKVKAISHVIAFTSTNK